MIGILQRAVLGHGAQTNDAGGGFFRAGDNVGTRSWRLVSSMVTRSQPSSMVNCGLCSSGGLHVLVISVVVLALDGIGGDVVVAIQRCRDFILRGKRIGSAEHDIRAAVAQRDHQVRGLAGHVKASGNAQALQRLLLDESLADLLQHGHLLRRPFDLALARIGKPDIFHIAFFQFCRSHS